MVVELPAILISDDDRELRETLRGLFEPEGFRTFLAQDGEEALEIVHTHEVHIVLIDMHMPKLTGLDVVRGVRQMNLLLPCILMSAELDDDIARQARDLKAFDVISKPFSSRQLRSTVGHALRWRYNWLPPADPGQSGSGPQ